MSTTRTPSSPVFRDAYDFHLPEMLALPEARVRKLNLDIPKAAQTVLGVLPQIAPYRDDLLALPHVPARAVLELESLTRALIHAHTRWLFARQQLGRVAKLVERGLVERRALVVAAKFFSVFGGVDASRLTDLRGRTGHRDLAMDLIGLCSLLRPVVHAAPAGALLTEAQLDRAEALGERILATLGERAQANLTVDEANLLRHRAFTMFIEAYEQVRRGIGFLRWDEGDAHTLAPQLFGGPGPRRRKVTNGATDAVEPALGSDPASNGSDATGGSYAVPSAR